MVYVLPLVAIGVALLALWLADRRRRAVFWIVLGVEVLLGVALVAAAALTRGTAESIAARDGPTLALAIAGEMSESFGGWVAAWMVAFALIGAVTWLLVRNRRSSAESA
jgi:hypothetical protein